MPLDVVRFRDSDFTALVDAEAFRAGFMLMCASWHQVPAGSLPSDDRILSNLAGFGRVVEEWKKYKDEALHGWILCDDGRYYHSVVCEKAMESWNSKQEYNYKKFCDRIRKLNLKLSDDEKITTPELSAWVDAGMPETWSKNSQVAELESEMNSKDIPQEFQNQSVGIPKENALKGKYSTVTESKVNNLNKHTNTHEQKTSAENQNENSNTENSDSENSLDEILNLWNPNLHEVNSWLLQSGERAMTQEQFDSIKPEFLSYYADRLKSGVLKERALFGKFVSWVKNATYKNRDFYESRSKLTPDHRNVNSAWQQPQEPVNYNRAELPTVTEAEAEDYI